MIYFLLSFLMFFFVPLILQTFLVYQVNKRLTKSEVENSIKDSVIRVGLCVFALLLTAGLFALYWSWGWIAFYMIWSIIFIVILENASFTNESGKQKFDRNG